MFEITFLGTSASAPSIQRGLSANLIAYKEYRFLIDCGEGTQRQLLRSGAGFRRLDKILLTHGHLDHILGLGGLASTFSRWEAIDQIDIFAGESALRRIRILIDDVVLGRTNPTIKINYRTLRPGLVFEDKGFSILAFSVQHRGADCFGFVFEEATRRPFNAAHAEALGIPHGPERKQLVEGKSITLTNGQVVHPDDVLGDPIPGTKLVFIADVGETESLLDIARGAHALVIEATYLQEDVAMARRFGHITAAEAARLAHDAGVKTLYLTHVSRRYRDQDILAEAREIFPSTILAQDLDHYQITRT